ncbi:unnamed protein product, partial [Symbiodinium microadriaticum]
ARATNPNAFQSAWADEELGRIFQQASLDHVDEREAVRTIQTLDELATSAGMHRKSVNALLQQL